MNRSRAIIIGIFIVFLVGIIVTFSDWSSISSKKTYYLQNEVLDISLPKEYKLNEENPVQVFYGDSEVAHIRFGTLKSFQFMETMLLNNTDENITLLMQSSSENTMTLYYCSVTNTIPEYIYIIYIKDSDTTIMLSSLDKERIEFIFNNMKLSTRPYKNNETFVE